MTWFKENKFLAGLILITLVLAGIIVFMGMTFGTTLDEKKEEIATKEGSLKDMKGLDPYPTTENAEAKRESLKALLESAETTQEKILTYRPESIDPIALTEFSAGLSKSVEEVKALFPGDKALPERFYLGFEAYSGSTPKEEATGILNYQREFFDWLFREMATAGVKEVMLLHREKLPIEDGEDWDNPKPQRGSSKKTSSTRTKGKPKGRTLPPQENLPKIAHAMPFEVTFRGPEGSVRRLFQSLANSDQYFVQARIARVRNEAPIPEAKKAKAAPADDAGDFGVIDDADPEAGAGASQILDHISGGENITVLLRADLLLFLDDKKLPELN